MTRFRSRQRSRRLQGFGAHVRAGFTLLELMVTIVILGIVIATVAPAVSRSLAKTRVQRASSVMVTDIQRAFSLAAQRRVPVRISVDTVNRAFYVRNVARDTVYLRNFYNASSELALSALRANDTTIIVFPNGMAENGFTVTVVAGPDNSRLITASKGGQVRISQP
jgi:prepilin-type N-terminal cleavage/methylation domain-containing protein